MSKEQVGKRVVGRCGCRAFCILSESGVVSGLVRATTEFLKSFTILERHLAPLSTCQGTGSSRVDRTPLKMSNHLLFWLQKRWPSVFQHKGGSDVTSGVAPALTVKHAQLGAETQGSLEERIGRRIFTPMMHMPPLIVGFTLS